MALITALLAAASALGVGLLTYRSNVQSTDVKRQEIALQQNRFDADERKRFDENITKLIPLLFDREQQRRDAALATLFALYPDRAEEVLSAARLALADGRVTTLQAAIERAAKRSQTAGNWVIVTGSDRTIAAATSEADKARQLGYSPTIYLRGERYAATIGPFPSRGDADRANIAVRQTIRTDTHVVSLDAWCRSQQPKGQFVECASR